MIRRRPWALCCLFVLIASLLANCGSTPTIEPEATEPLPTEQPSPTPTAPPVVSAAAERIQAAINAVRRMPGTVLATVNGAEITWEDYEPMLRQTLYSIESQNAVEWRDPAMQQRLGALQEEVLRQTVDRVLLVQLAVEQGIQVDPEKLEADITAEKEDILTNGGYPDWETFLKLNSLTDASFRKIMHDRLLLQAFLEAQVVETREEQAKVAHIVVADEQTALEVKAKLEAGGDFAQLAAEYSIDEQTKNDGGLLGWFSRETMRAELAEAAFSLPSGSFAGPFVTTHGRTFIQVLGREIRDADPRVIASRQQGVLAQQLETKRAESQIEYLVDFAEPES
jgi:foldase protein PrsA